jgi:tetratricopeptide (TPR) repeat protein
MHDDERISSSRGRFRVVLRAALLFALTDGCVQHRQAAWQHPPAAHGEVGDTVIESLTAGGDRAYAARAEPARLDEALSDYRAALRYRPDSVSLRVRAARAALARASTQSGSDAQELLDEALRHGELAVAAATANQQPAVDAGQVSVQPPEGEALSAFTVYAEALLAWAENAGRSTLKAERGRIQAAALRVAALDRRAGHGAPDRILGTLWATVPSGAGADLPAAREHFEAALAAAPHYLPNRIAYAERYAKRVGDGALHRRLLDEVLAADPQALPESGPENAAAQEDARRLLRSR